MSLELGWRRWVLIIWACALAFGFGFAVPQAQALDAGCLPQCIDDCGRGNCGNILSDGCNCWWSCADGGGGESSCAL
ncbi:MAG: hypothetical protein ACOC5E_03530 [Acidobacteriota bacterium]